MAPETIISLLLTVISVTGVIVFGITSAMRNKTKDDKEQSSQLTTMIVKLENISTTCTEIKNELFNVKEEMKQHAKRLTIVEQSVKSAHRRLDEHIQDKITKEG